jgi:hypothetical protein
LLTSCQVTDELKKDYTLSLEEPYRRTVIDVLNQVFAGGPESDKFWNDVLKPAFLRKFTGAQVSRKMTSSVV